MRRVRDAAAASEGALRPAPAGAHTALKIVLDTKLKIMKSTEKIAKVVNTSMHATIDSKRDAAKYLQNFVIERAELGAAENSFADIFINTAPDYPLRR